MSEKYQVSSSPHVRAKDSTSRVMLYVIIALLPATLFGIWNFGMHALLLILVTIASCLASEWIFDKIVHKKNSLPDLSAVVTGLLLALNLPAGLPWWEAVIGSVFAIVIVKMMFGGLGQNFMNPALGGRCFLLIAFAADMTNFKSSKFEAYSGATPLAMIRNEGLSSVNVMDMLTGKIPGTIRDRNPDWCDDPDSSGRYHITDSGCLPDYICGIYADFWQGTDECQLSGCRTVRWWSDAWCILYGNRLCDFTDYTGRSDYLRYLLWSVNRYFPLFRSKCRGCFFCNHPEQYFSTDY